MPGFPSCGRCWRRSASRCRGASSAAFALDGVTKGSLARATIDAEVTTGAGKMTVKGAVTDLLEPLPGLDLAVDARGLQPQFLAAFLSQGPGRSYPGPALAA